VINTVRTICAPLQSEMHRTPDCCAQTQSVQEPMSLLSDSWCRQSHTCSSQEAAVRGTHANVLKQWSDPAAVLFGLVKERMRGIHYPSHLPCMLFHCSLLQRMNRVLFYPLSSCYFLSSLLSLVISICLGLD
jgi:hypothetical protein